MASEFDRGARRQPSARTLPPAPPRPLASSAITCSAVFCPTNASNEAANGQMWRRRPRDTDKTNKNREAPKVALNAQIRHQSTTLARLSNLLVL